MTLLVVGSIALDSVCTPFGDHPNILGGAASYFSVGASLFTQVRLAGVIGEDFPEEHMELFKSRNIDLTGLRRIEGGKTFRWSGKYVDRMDVAETLDTQLNVLGECKPELPDSFKNSEFVLLANDHPLNQLSVTEQLDAPRFVMMDTMNLWIDNFRDDVLTVLKAVDAIVCNDEEARSLGGDANLIAAMNNIAKMGPKTVLIKKGEHGAIVLHEGKFFALPAYPLSTVKDPTGAGDTFASGVMGYLAREGSTDFKQIKKAMSYGTVVASYNVEDFGLDRLRTLTWDDIEKRHEFYSEFLDVNA
ncbi:MAG: sugar/nucleoside kinase (ribokinase family) [Planctomycetota bacterium]|jgi:sugar/nucleoside kinase (ribokinase family)